MKIKILLNKVLKYIATPVLYCGIIFALILNLLMFIMPSDLFIMPMGSYNNINSIATVIISVIILRVIYVYLFQQKDTNTNRMKLALSAAIFGAIGVCVMSFLSAPDSESRAIALIGSYVFFINYFTIILGPIFVILTSINIIENLFLNAITLINDKPYYRKAGVLIFWGKYIKSPIFCSGIIYTLIITLAFTSTTTNGPIFFYVVFLPIIILRVIYVFIFKQKDNYLNRLNLSYTCAIFGAIALSIVSIVPLLSNESFNFVGISRIFMFFFALIILLVFFILTGVSVIERAIKKFISCFLPDKQ